MKAVQINRYGGYEVLEINQNAPTPSIDKEQVLVKVQAASINPFDGAVRSGALQKMAPLQFPITLGGDFSGIVSEVGTDVSEYKVGDEVYGSANILSGGSGSFAEYAQVRISNMAKKPKNADFIESAALPLVGSSAVQALEEHIKLQNKQKILIHGGAGGIGHIAIQLAKALGAYVATTVSTDDMEFVIQLGTDEIIDYKNEKFEEKIKDFDAILDTVGGEVTNKSLAVLRKGGTLVSMIGQPDLKLAEKLGVIAIRQRTRVSTQHLERLAQLVENGNIKIKIAKIFPLDQVREAFKYQEEGYPRGKVVIKVK